MVTLIFRDKNGTYRQSGWARYGYSSDVETEQTAATSEDELSAVFEESGVDELAGTGDPIEAAIEDPLRFRDFLILEDGEITFDDEYEREDNEDDEP